MQFVRENSVGDVTRELGVARGTVHRLRHGYWPADPDKLLTTWGRFKASRSVVESSWFMRRVKADGTVRHAGKSYTAPRLAARAGHLLAVARSTEGGFVAQTLELPAERMSLMLAPLAEQEAI